MVPGELIKMRLQIGRYTGLGHALRSIYSTSGIAGFYTGYWAVCLRDIPYTMLELGLVRPAPAPLPIAQYMAAFLVPFPIEIPAK